MRMNGDDTLSFAEEELRKYLKMAGLPDDQMPEIQFFFEKEEEHDRYSIESTPDSILVRASNKRSVLMGCYAYLNEIGFRFYAPGSAYTKIPKLCGRDQLITLHKKGQAENFHRGVCIEGSESIENVLDYIDWMPKVGMNACFLQFFRPDVFFQRWYKHENNPTLPPEQLTEERLRSFDEILVQACRKRSLMIHRAGHGWTSRALGFSGNGWQTEKEPNDPRIIKRLAQLGGERKLFGGIPANTNLCYADSDAQEALVTEVVAYAEAHPETDYLHFWLADTHNNVCECEACKRTTLSDQYVALLNRIDEMLTAKELNTRIVFLLYQELLYPPKKERIQNPERFTLMFAPISRTFEKPYPAQIDKKSLPKWQRNRMTLPVDIEENLGYYRAWREIFHGDAFIYDYHLGRAHYGDLGYMTIARTLREDVSRIGNYGLSGMVACQELRVLMPNALPIYAMGRMLWNSSESFDEIAGDYFRGLYGENATWVQTYFDEVSALCDTDYTNAGGPRLRPDLTRRYVRIAELSEALVERLGAMDRNALLERLNTVAEQNVLHARALAALTAGDVKASQQAFAAFCLKIRTDEIRYQPELDVYRMIEVSQKFTGLREG